MPGMDTVVKVLIAAVVGVAVGAGTPLRKA